MLKVLLLLLLTAIEAHSGMEMGGVSCPVCGMEATGTNVLQLKGGQKVRFCNEMPQDKEQFLLNAQEYFHPHMSTDVAIQDIEPNIQCPVTAQPLVSCLLSKLRHVMLKNSKQKIYACGEEQVMELRNHFVRYLTQDAENTTPYCIGNGAVMLNGFGDSSNLCTIFIFHSIVINSFAKYLVAIATTIFIAMSAEWLRLFRGHLMKRILSSTYSKPTADEIESQLESRTTNKMRLLMALLYAIQIGQAYVLMVIAMTFRSGLFFSVLFGFALGNILFDNTAPVPSAQACHA